MKNINQQISQRTKTLLLALSVLTGLGAGLCAPSHAAIQRSADFTEGQTIGLGLYGLSYDYGIGFFSAGLAIQSASSSNLSNPFNNPLKPGLRLVGRIYQQEGLSASVLGGLLFDPGFSGDRPLLTPDLGLGIAYDFRQVFQMPFALRMNLTLGFSDGRNRYTPIDESTPTPNFFQRLSFGPQTSLELAWIPTDHLEVTLGGGTLLGMRLKF
ncbi:MAG: hypothetical protein ACAI44_05865 [Candidatus Sericytochromatia bacterium]